MSILDTLYRLLMSSRPESDLLVCPVEVLLVEVEADADLVLVGVDLPGMMRGYVETGDFKISEKNISEKAFLERLFNFLVPTW